MRHYERWQSMFTDKYIQSLSPRNVPYRIFEKGSDKGFGIQVSKNAKTFFMQYKSPITRKRCFIRLGSYPQAKLTIARNRSRVARDLVDIGQDPQQQRDKVALQARIEREEAIKQAEIDNNTGTVAELFDAYIANMILQGKRSHKDVQQLYDKDIKNYIGHLKACSVTAQHIKNIIKRIYKRGAINQAKQVRTYIMAAYTYGIRADNDPTATCSVMFRLEHNPARDVPVSVKVNPGERNLSSDEIRDLWYRLDDASMDYPAKIAIKLLFAVGGQRVEEVLGMRWDELDFDAKTWELSSSRTKNNKPHVVPLSDLAIDLIKSLDQTSNETYLFPRKQAPDKPMPFNTVSQAVRRFCCPPINKDGKLKSHPFNKFVPKDIRRTVKSRMGELGISKDIRDRLHNHAFHDVSSKHYDRYDYFQPKKVAMDKWTQWLETIIFAKNSQSNVIELTA